MGKLDFFKILIHPTCRLSVVKHLPPETAPLGPVSLSDFTVASQAFFGLNW